MGDNVVSFIHLPYLSPLGSWINTILVFDQQEVSFRKTERAAGLHSSSTKSSSRFIRQHPMRSCLDHSTWTAAHEQVQNSRERTGIETIALRDRCQDCGGVLRILLNLKMGSESL